MLAKLVETRITPIENNAGKMSPCGASPVIKPVRPSHSAPSTTAKPAKAEPIMRADESKFCVKKYPTTMPGSTACAMASTSIDPLRSTTNTPSSEQATAVTTASKAVPTTKFMMPPRVVASRSEEHTSELQSRGQLVCRL